MATDEEINNALLAIHSKLGVIEGKVNLVARAHKQTSLDDIEQAVRAKPLLGQAYLLLDGVRTQTELLDKLGEYGISSSKAGVSRAMTSLETDFGMADLVRGGASKVFRKDAESERVLNLSTNIRKWLTSDGHTVPEEPPRRRRKKPPQ
jgi:hypothetical protein